MVKRTLTSVTPTRVVKRLRFVSESVDGSMVIALFTQPRVVAAVVEKLDAPALPEIPWPLPTDQGVLVLLSSTNADPIPADLQEWIDSHDGSDAFPAVRVAREGLQIVWRPGRAIIAAPADQHAVIEAALVEFIFYEGELRALETALAAHQLQARSDVLLAHRIRYRDRKHWNEFGNKIEYFSGLRLTFAQLEPELVKGSRKLTPFGRAIVTRLIAKADIEDRLEAASNRLETYEDLYEGANDRIADFRWYRTGHLLEIGIIVLLLVEAMLMVTEMYLHYLEFRRDSKGPEAQQAQDQSEEFRANILRVADGRITFQRTGLNRGNRYDEMTLPVADNIKVYKGKIDKETKEVEAGAAIEGGLQHEMFTTIAAKGLAANILTDSENKRIVEIDILPIGKRAP